MWSRWGTGVVFVFLSVMAMAQSPLVQPIHLSFREISLDSALVLLMQEEGVLLSYSADVLPAKRTFSRQYLGTPLIEVLDDLLEGTELAYTFIGRQVVIFRAATQPKFFQVSGIVTDATSGERMIGANIYDPVSLQGTTTNAYGFYSLRLPEGSRQIVYSYLGYRAFVQNIHLVADSRHDVGLQPDGQLEPVIVSEEQDLSQADRRDRMQELDLRAMQELPALAGEPDLVRFSSLQPGIVTGTDGFGGVHVRGGNADQNLFLLDGVPVYSPTHAAGMFSIFNSQAIRSARLYKGGFPARYGGRLSSVYDIRLKEGNNQKLQGEAGISMIAAKLAIEGPIEQEASSFFVSARRTTVDPWLRSATRYVQQERGNNGFSDFHFYDVHAKVNFTSGLDHRFYVSFYHGSDHFHDERGRSVLFQTESRNDHSQADLDWGNTIASFRWNWILHPRWFLNTTIFTTRFRFSLLDFYEFVREDQQQRQREFDLLSFSSMIHDTGIKLEGEYHPGDFHRVRFGGGLIQHRFQPGVMALDENSVDADVFVSNGRVRNLDSLPAYGIIRSLEGEAYLEDEWTPHPHWTILPGLYANLFDSQGKSYLSLQPRIQIMWQPIPAISLRAAGSRMAQNLHLLTNSGLGLPSDLWVPASANIRPLVAWQGETGVTWQHPSGWQVEGAAYIKQMEHLLTWRQDAGFLVNGNFLQGGLSEEYWENLVTAGSGEARGLEISVKKVSPRYSGYIAYSLANTRHRFPLVNGGRPFPFRYDRRHVVHITQEFQLAPPLKLGMVWSWASGNPITIPQGQFDVHSLYFIAPGIDFSERNAYRMKDYHRLDLTLRYTVQQAGFTHTLDLGVYNVYNRLNPQFIRVRENIYNREQRDLVEVSLLPVLPVISYQIRLL